MSHEFDSGLFVQEKAWHGLGNLVSEAPNTSDAIAMAGMDWKVNERMAFDYVPGSEPMPLDGWKALRRSDNNGLLHVCLDSWTPVQNIDAFKFFDPLIQDGDVKLDAAVSLDDGKKVCITAKVSGGVADIVKSDPVEQYIILFNSHNGSLPLGVMFTNIRVVCANTLGFALSDAKRRGHYAKFKGADDIAIHQKMVRLRHTRNIHDNLSIVRDAVDISRRQFDLSIESYRALANKSMNTDLFKAYLTKVFAHELNIGTEKERKIEDYGNYEQLEKNFESGIGIADIKGVSGTAWAGLQAVTEFTTHQRGKKIKSPTEAQKIEAQRARLDQQWFGEGSDINDRAYCEALALL